MTDRTAAAPEGFLDFFRRYARTWVHAVATAGLTALGTLTVVHRWFAVLALAVYVLTPVALYLSRTAGTRTGANPDADTTGWTTAEVPVETTLFDAAVTPAAAYAVGEDGVVLADRGDGWTAVIEDGPGANSRTLRGVDATSDGTAVWTAGDGGSLARFDAERGRHVDFSAPEGITDAWLDVAVGGESGSETLLLVNGSGETVRGRYRGDDVAWTSPAKPGSGSSFGGVDFAEGSVAYLCDTNDGVFETVDDGETFRRVGIEAADGTLTDVAAVDRDECTVTADDGVAHRYDGKRWTPDSLDDGAVLATARHGEYGIACGEGVVYERSDPGGGWDRTATPATGTLRGVAAGDDRAVAVGDAGAVVERRR